MKKSSKPKAKEIPKFLGQPVEHTIKFSFNDGEEDCYEFDEGVMFLPYIRGNQATLFYKEVQMGVDRDYLLWFLEEMDKVLNPTEKKLNLERLYILKNVLKEKVQYIFDPDLIYNLASVVYFDKNEDPYKFNLDYSKKKIARWKKNESVESFFLRLPIKRLTPFLNSQEETIITSIQLARKLKEDHARSLSSQPSKENTTLQKNLS